MLSEFVLRQNIKVLNHIFHFQFRDLRAALEKAKANFLAAQGLVICTEFLGGLHNGQLGLKGKSRQRFENGLALLGPEFRKFGFERLWKVRNGLVHSYIPETVDNFEIKISNDRNSSISVLKRVTDKKAIINPPSWLRELRGAKKSLIDEMQNKGEVFDNVNKSLTRIGNLQ